MQLIADHITLWRIVDWRHTEHGDDADCCELARNHSNSASEPDFREEAPKAFALTPHNVAFAVGTRHSQSNSSSACPSIGKPCNGAVWACWAGGLVAVARRHRHLGPGFVFVVLR